MEQQYIQLYKKYSQDIKKHSADILNKYRDESFYTFERLGFPTRALEDYKYTNLEKPLSLDYGLNINRLFMPINPYEAFTCGVPGIQSYLYFVVNDSFYTMNKSVQQQLPNGVIIGSINQIAKEHPELLERYFGKLSAKREDGIMAFNGAFAQDGFFLYVPKNVVLDKPVQIINVMRANVDFMANSHNLVILEEGAQARILICDHTMGDVRFLANRLTEVFISENAVYEHYNLENTSHTNTNLSTLLIDQKESSNVLTNSITLHNGITRNNIEIALNGEHCEALLCGMVLSDKKQQVDNFTSILHNKPNCHSNELFKYILDDDSSCGFTGRLVVAKDAQKTAAFQTNKNLLLNNNARMRTKPQLEIYADDVKCSHGATIGQLDENAMFYLRSRGISAHEARLLLMYAFTSDIIDNVKIDALQDHIKMLVEKRLHGEISKCEGCTACL